MKTKYRILYLLMFLPMIVTLLVFPKIPHQIPAHYDLAGNITRWGSKYEKLITPIVTIFMGLFFKVIAMYCRKSDKECTDKNVAAKNEKILIISGIATMIYFNGMTYVLLYKGYYESIQTSQPIEIEFYKIISILMGFTLIIIGNIMPKTKLNSFIGLRTSWSMANEKAWFASQRMSGLSFVISGLITMLGCIFFFHKFEAFIFANICLLVSLIWTIIYSRIAYKKSIENN